MMNIPSFNLHHSLDYLPRGEFTKLEERKGSQKLTPQTFTFEKQELPEVDSTLPLGKITKMPSVYREVNDYFLFIQEIGELSNGEKESIFRAIEASIVTPVKKSDEYDKAMAYGQMKFELEFIADYVLPEEYRSQMNEAVQKFITFVIDSNQRGARARYEASLKNPETLSYAKEAAKVRLQELDEGRHFLQTEIFKYITLFEELREGEEKDFLQNYEKILAIYTQDQRDFRASFWSYEQAQGVEMRKESFRAKWNHVLSQLFGFEQWRLPTQAQAFVDVKI